MRFFPCIRVGSVSLAALALLCASTAPIEAEDCPLVLPASPSNTLVSYITEFPNYKSTNSLGLQQPLVSYFLVDVTNKVSATNYLNPPIPYGLYPAWCVDEWNFLITKQITVPGNLYTGSLYSTCDPNLNSELPPGHTNTLVSAAVWQMVNYILNHQTYSGTNAFYWDVQAAINNLVGNGTGAPPYGGGSSLKTPLPDGGDYPTYNTNIVNYLLSQASNNASSWIPQCGDVYGAVYATQVTTNQFIMLEVPVPCTPCIGISKQVACFLGGTNCGAFGSVAEGFAGPGCNSTSGNPAFCYEISITNCGSVPLTNVTVMDNLLGNLTTNFFATPGTVFEPGASATVYFSMSFPTNATNTVVAQGDAALSSAVTNGTEVYTNGYPVASTASAVALVTQASVSCDLSLYSPYVSATNGGTTIILPSLIPSQPAVSVSLTVSNSGAAPLSSVTVEPINIQGLTCSLPSPFSLPVGGSTNIQLCIDTATCPVNQTFNVSVTGVVDTDATHCSVLNLSGSPITVCCSSLGAVECSGTGGCDITNELSGTIVLDCSVGSTNLLGDTGLSGWTVSLYGSSSNLLTSTTTDTKGNYAFYSLGSGSYTVVVSPPANYVQTYPVGVTNNQEEVTVVACQNSGANFGYADTTPPQLSVPPGSTLSCNASNSLPSDSAIASTVVVTSVSCGTSNIMVTHVDTNNGCSYTRTYYVTVTDTYGNAASNTVVYTWIYNATPLSLSGTPTNSYLGCNPLTIPSDSSVTNGMSASNACGSAPLSVTNSILTNGCSVTDTFTITAMDSCSNSASATVVYTWTANNSPLAMYGTPSGGYLGCNPTSLPTTSSVTSGMTASNSCGSAPLSVTNSITSSGCLVTDTFTISAVDGCGNTGSAVVVYTWTANNTPLAMYGTPSGGDLGCNPTSLPTTSSVTSGMVASNSCGSAPLSVTNSILTNGCSVTDTFTISALDGCSNSASVVVVYTWTANNTPLAMSGTPLGGYLGCNPTNLPTDSSVTSGMSASNSCGSAPLSVTNSIMTNNCLVTDTFTITAIDTCSNMGSAVVVYTWTVNSTPLVMYGTPTNSYLGCNPLTLPSDSSVTNGMSASNSCGSAPLSVTNSILTNGCSVTDTFTITAADACGNTGSSTVVYTWTANNSPLAMYGTPSGGYLGCNPTSLPTTSSVTSGMTASNSCGSAPLSVTNSITSSGCLVTDTFTISAVDGCGNTGSAVVVYTWTANDTPLAMYGTPSGGDLGCNPTSLPTTSSVTSGMVASNSCGSAPLSVTNSILTNGCSVTDTFTISAVDGCSNSASVVVVYTWTANNSPLGIYGAPSGGYLGCNPTNLPTDSSVTSGMSASNSCGSAPLSVTNNIMTNNCLVTDTFTITAIDTCSNMGSAVVVYTWTVNSTPLVMYGTPTNSYLGCNPLTLPSDSSVTNGMSASNSCGSAPLSVTNSILTNGCSVTDTFTITAADACGNTGSSTVVYTWTANNSPLAMYGTPSGGYLGCNPTSLPTTSSVTSGMTASNSCGSAPLSVTNSITSSGCLVTDTFTISAVDGCGNTGSAVVVYTWTANDTPLAMYGTPSGGDLGCNPTSLPTTSSVTSGMVASNSCGSAPLSVTNSILTNGCSVTDTFTISAVDSCSNSASVVVVYTWTANNSPLGIYGAPSGGYLGCNPTNLPTDSSVTSGMSASNSCGSAPLSVTNSIMTNNCLVTDTFTITAIDTCSNVGSAVVVYTWTVNSTPLSLYGAPTNSYLGCNPLTLPSDSSVTNGMSASNSCGSAPLSVTNSILTNGCSVTDTFTITAADACGNTGSTTVVYTWTANNTPLGIYGAPAGGPLGCNPSSLPTCSSVISGVTASNSCGTAPLSVTNSLSTNGCLVTDSFTISAVDGCGNKGSTVVVYTWTANNTPLGIYGTPAGGNLGCNPSSLPTCSSVISGVTASNSCGTAPLSVTNSLSTNSCLVTDSFTISAVDGCGNKGSTVVVYTWTANNTPLGIYGAPAGGPLGCNPSSLPTCSSVISGVTASNSCGTAPLSVTNSLSTNGCLVTDSFTISAVDGCGNKGSTVVVYTWTANNTPLGIYGAPAGGNLGCNPTNLPTCSSVISGVTASNSCGTAPLSVTNSLSTNGCLVTDSFTISAVDSCGNKGSTAVTYTWTADTGSPVLHGVVAGSYLGCNPTNLPTTSSVLSGVSATNGCGTATPSATCVLTTNGCYVTNTFTIKATDSCGNSTSTNVVYSWTANTTAPVLHGVVAGSYLGCNPTNLPTTTSVLSGVSATNSCGTATPGATSVLTTNGCYVTNTFTIKATDGCGNSTSTNVAYSWTASTTAPVLRGVVPGSYLGCNPASLPTTSSVLSGVSATNGCGTATPSATSVLTTNGCYVTNTFTIKAVDGCGNTTTTNVVFSWIVNTTPPAISGVPAGGFLGCGSTNLPSAANILAVVSASGHCGTASVSVTNVDSISGCSGTRTFTISAVDGCGNTAGTNLVYTWTVLTPTSTVATNVSVTTMTTVTTNITITTNSCTNEICGSFNSQNPGTNCWVWFNSHINCKPGVPVTLNCQNAAVTLNCQDGKSYTYQIPNGCIQFSSSCTTGTNWYDGTNWHTTLPCAGDDGAFLQGCAIPWQSDFANCQSVCWTGVFQCSQAGFDCQWQWGAACYNEKQPSCQSIAPKACHQTACQNGTYYNSGDQCGTPENCNPYCVGGGTGGGGANCTGSWSSTGTTCTFTAPTTNISYTTNTTYTTNVSYTTNVTYSSAPPILTGVPTGQSFGCNPTNVPTTASILAEVSASDTCSPATVHVTVAAGTNGCAVTQIFTIIATNGCGGMAEALVTNTWTANTVAPVIHSVPTGSYLGCNPASLPSLSSVTNGVSATATCGSATLSATSTLTTNGCFVTNTFTITATDGCGNTTKTTVIYSWLSNPTGPIVTCPTNVTIVTNMSQMYCTFSPSDWSGSCDGGNNYNNNWWQNWCSHNSTSQCWSTWTNWWNNCGANNNQCSNVWNCWNGGNNNYTNNWWGCTDSQWNNQWSGQWGQWGQRNSWYGGWNNCNSGSHNWVPCGGNNPDTVLNNCFSQIYPSGCVTVGCTNGNGYCASFTSCSAAQTCLNWNGTPGCLNQCYTNASSCNAGSFCAQVLALKLNCDFGDYGCAPGFVGKCGDLVYCDSTSPCNGQKVRNILGCCNNVLGGGACPQGCSVSYLCGLCSNINQCFEGCQVSGWCSSNLASVYIPTPAQTGTATVSDVCSPNPTLTYCDTITQASCSGNYVINREWIAVDSCGNSNTCTQVITVAQSNSCNLSGIVVLACSGDSNLNNNEGIANLTVTVESGNTVVATTTTSASGAYSFENLAPGNYTVVVTPPSGYTETYPASSGNSTNVSVSACGSLTNVNFSYVGSTLGVQLFKTAPSCVSHGCAITYTFAVTNTGNTCETLSVVDPMLGGTIFSQSSVAPGQGFVFTSNYTAGSSCCMITNTASAIGTSNGKSVTNTSTAITCVTTTCVTNTLCGNFNSQNPGNGYVWCNAHLNCTPGKACTVYCQNASVTFSCNDGKTYTFPVPDCQIKYTNCSSGSCSYSGSTWATTLPCAGDSQCFLSGCGIPWQSDFANAQVCWTGTFRCSAPSVSCNWQWGAACYNNSNFGNCGNVSVKPCLQTACGYPTGDQCGTPENCKSSCQGGACGGGGSNWTGSWSGTGSFSCN